MSPEVRIVQVAVYHPSVEPGGGVGGVMDCEEPVTPGGEGDGPGETGKIGVVVAADDRQAPGEPARCGQERGGVGRSAQVAHQVCPVVRADRPAPVLHEDPVHLRDIGGEERSGAVERDPGVPEVQVSEEPGFAGRPVSWGVAIELQPAGVTVGPERGGPEPPVGEERPGDPAARDEIEACDRPVTDQDEEAERVEQPSRRGNGSAGLFR